MTAVKCEQYNRQVFNRQAAASKWARKREDGDEAVKEIEEELDLPSGPGFFSTDTKGFWSEFKDYVKKKDLESAFRIFKSERGILPDDEWSEENTEGAFEFLRIMGNVPEWAHDYCPDHVMTKDRDKPDDDNGFSTYECETCWMTEKA